MTSLDLFSLRDRTVIITGAGSGLGRAMAIGAGEAHGNVVCADVNEEAAVASRTAITEAGGAAIDVQVDVTDERSVAADD